MVAFTILGIMAVALFCFSLTMLLSRSKKINLHDAFLMSITICIGSLGYIIFILNQFIGVRFDFWLSIKILIALIVLSALFVLIFFIRRQASASSKLSLGKMTWHSLWKENRLLKITMVIIVLLMFYKALFFPIVNGDAIGFQANQIKEIYQANTLPTDVGPNTMEFTRAYPPLLPITGAWLVMLGDGFNDVPLRLLPPLFGLLMLIATYALGLEVLNDKRKALLASFLMLILPMFVNSSVYFSRDTMFSFFALCGAYFVIRYLRTKDMWLLAVGFINLGFASNVQYLGNPFFISIAVPLLFMLFWKKISSIIFGKKGVSESWERIKKTAVDIIKSKELKAFLVGLLLFIIVVSPFLVRNMLQFNDPLYPYLSASSLQLKGKNFVPFLYQPLAEANKRLSLFYAPEYTAFFMFNFIRDKGYSMSLFLLMVLLFALVDFKHLRKEQKYLLYFSIIFTIYYALSFLAKYRYLMPVVALLCVVAADHFGQIIDRKPDKSTKRAFIVIAVLLLFALVSYLLMLAKKDFVVGLLGFRAEHFISSPDLMVMMHLIVPLAALVLLLMVKNRKMAAGCVIVVLLVPTIYSLAVINYGVTGDMFKEGFGFIDNTKDMQLFRSEALRLIPSQEAILKLNMGDYYDLVQFVSKNTPSDAVMLTVEAGSSYYLERELISADSYRMADSYSADATMDSALKLLKEQGINYILYRIPGWDAAVFGKGALLNQSAVIRNLGNSSFFEEVYRNNDFVVYRVNQ
ncbi:MAG: phospholipid carrier-dependent glycosyltransferase [archaeon]